MKRVAVGRVVALFRYPVKSMAAQQLNSVHAGWNGLDGDRRWAFIRDGMERNGFPWMTIRQKAELWKYEPRFVDPGNPDKSETIVRSPSGAEYDVADPALGAELGAGVRVIRQGRGIFDTFPLSLISTQTIAALGAQLGEQFDPRRFRPNIVVDAADGGDAPENSWVGSVLTIGGLEMRVDKRDKRCVVVNVNPATLEKNPSVLQLITAERESCAGVYGTTVTPGVLSVGDEVVLETGQVAT